MRGVLFERDSIMQWLDDGFDHEQIAYIFDVTVEDVRELIDGETELSAAATLDFLYEHKHELILELALVRAMLIGKRETESNIIDGLHRRLESYSLTRKTIKRMLPDLLDLEADQSNEHRSKA